MSAGVAPTTGRVMAVGRARRGGIVGWAASGRWWPAAYGLLLGVVVYAVAGRAMPDDGLISLSFARNLAEHGQWALTTGVESNTATSPLNVWLLAGLIVLTGHHAFIAVAVLLAAALAVTAVWLHTLGGPWAAGIGTALLATSPVLTSSLGLETYLAAAVFVGLVRYGAQGRLVPTAVGVAAAVLTRPDMVVVAVVAVGILALRRWSLVAALPLGGVFAAPWFVFSWFHFGSAWANSVALKWAGTGWSGTYIDDTAFWWGLFPAAVVVIAVTGAAGAAAVLVGVVRRDAPVVALGVAGAVHLAALVATEAPPIEYYLGPATTGLGLAAAVAAGRVGVARWVGRVGAGAAVAGALALSVAHGSLWAQGFAPMRQNWATDAEYARIVDDLPTDGVIHASTEIGAFAFYCQDRGCTVVDELLAYPAGVDRAVAHWREFHPWGEINYHFYRRPPLLPGRYRLDYVAQDPPAPGDWRISREPYLQQSAHVTPVPDGYTGNLHPLY